MLPCSDRRIRQSKVGETICDYDEGFHEIGIIDKDTASVARYEYNGTKTILECLGPQDIFGHLLFHGGSEHADISVVRDSPCNIPFIHYAIIGFPCTKFCTHYHQSTQSLLGLTTERALNLGRRVKVPSQRIICEKLVYYFMQLVAQAKASPFSLSFTTVDLVDYPSIGRNATTRELKRMKEERLVEMDKRCARLFLWPVFRPLGAHRASKVISLYIFYSQFPYDLTFPFCLHSLQAYLPACIMAQVGDRLDKGGTRGA